MRTVRIAVGFLGLIGGFFLGVLIYTIVLATLHKGALWIMICFSILCSIIGGFLSFKFSKQVVLFFTSLIGSYLFMRGFAYFFGGFPDEEELLIQLKNHEPVNQEFTIAFWIYLTLFLIGFLIGLIF